MVLINKGTHFVDSFKNLPKESLENNLRISTVDFDNDGLNDFFIPFWKTKLGIRYI